MASENLVPALCLCSQTTFRNHESTYRANYLTSSLLSKQALTGSPWLKTSKQRIEASTQNCHPTVCRPSSFHSSPCSRSAGLTTAIYFPSDNNSAPSSDQPPASDQPSSSDQPPAYHTLTMAEPSNTTTTVQAHFQGGIIVLETDKVCRRIIYIAVFIVVLIVVVSVFMWVGARFFASWANSGQALQ